VRRELFQAEWSLGSPRTDLQRRKCKYTGKDKPSEDLLRVRVLWRRKGRDLGKAAFLRGDPQNARFDLPAMTRTDLLCWGRGARGGGGGGGGGGGRGRGWGGVGWGGGGGGGGLTGGGGGFRERQESMSSETTCHKASRGKKPSRRGKGGRDQILLSQLRGGT